MAIGLLSLLTLLAFNTPLQAQTEDPWQNSVRLYQEGRFTEALELLRQSPQNDAYTFYNLGAVHYKLNQYGIALAYFEKARTLAPRDRDIRFNLDLARQRFQQTGQTNLDPAASVIDKVVDPLNNELLQILAGLLSTGFGFVFFTRYRKAQALKPMLLQPLGFLGAVILAGTWSVVGLKYFSSRNPVAVCIESTTVRSGPGTEFLELAQLEPGIKVRQASESSTATQWFQIYYGPDAVGWVPKTTLLLL